MQSKLGITVLLNFNIQVSKVYVTEIKRKYENKEWINLIPPSTVIVHKIVFIIALEILHKYLISIFRFCKKPYGR